MPLTAEQLAVGICAKDSMRTIERTIESSLALTPRVLVIDSGSTDGTVERCRAMGAEVRHHDWLGFARQKQLLLDACADARWVFIVDSDESPEPDLAEAIVRTVTDDDESHVGWAVNRKVHFDGAWLHHVFQPEWRLRLVRGGRARITALGDDDPESTLHIHEQLVVDGRTGRLQGDLRHDTWTDTRDMCRRYVAYAAQCADCGVSGGNAAHVLLSPAAAFLKQYVLKRGFLDGRRGLTASGGAALGVLAKHLILRDRRR